jgi:hypothetical protein
VKGYQLGLENAQPAFLRSWPEEEEFTIGTFVEILSEISPDKALYGNLPRPARPLRIAALMPIDISGHLSSAPALAGSRRG